jgi:hypothetical protein
VAATIVMALATVGLVTQRDSMARRVSAELGVFTQWLTENNVRGHVGEFGWPNDVPEDQEQYNLLADRYLHDMRAAGLTGSQWATGEWWGSSYRLSVYARAISGGPVNARRTQASIFERHTDIAGIHVNGGEFGAPSGTTRSSTFSNVNPGTYGTDWHYDSQATFDYLASRGVRQVVIPFRWERVQPTLGGSFHSAEMDRVRTTIGRAHAAGLTAVPMVANYGAYWLYDPVSRRGTRRAVGTPEVTIAHFADLWTKLSRAFEREPGISAYGLMREPIGQPGLTNRDQAKVWEEASQAAVDAIRARGDRRLLLVPGYRYSNLHDWPTQHPVRWIVDPADNHRYEAHHYWDSEHSGDY